MSPRVSIIIVNWNGLEHLETCLDSLKNQSFRDFEVVLVDNGSQDGSVGFLRKRYPWVRLTELMSNSGFAGGNNIGLKGASGDYIVTLNNDTRVEPDWLEKLVAVADDHPTAGMVGCRIVSFDNPGMIDSLGMKICRDGMTRGAYRKRDWSTLSIPPTEILFPSACAALYKRAMIDDVGFFDADFFAYCEDTDLGLRGRIAGWDAILAPDAVVFHKYSGTGGAFSPFKLFLVERNHYWVVLKNYPLPLLLVVPFYTLARFLVQVRAIFASRGSGRESRASGSRAGLLGAVLRGMAAALIGVPRMVKKRRTVMRNRKLSNALTVRLLRKHQLTFSELLDLEVDGESRGSVFHGTG